MEKPFSSQYKTGSGLKGTGITMWHDCGSCVSFGGRREGDRASQQVLPMIPERPTSAHSLNPLTVKHRPLVLVSGSHSTAELGSFVILICFVFSGLYTHISL